MSTTLNDFNSKVNLAKVLQKYAEFKNSYSVLRLAPFGDFAYSPDFSIVLNIFDLLKKSQTPAEVYRSIVQDWPDCLRQEVTWHQYTQDKIAEESHNQETWAELIGLAQAEFLGRRKSFDDKTRTPWVKKYEELGLLGAQANGVGSLSKTIMETFKDSRLIGLDIARKYENPFIMPYYHTPSKRHISFIEVFEGDDFEHFKREKLYAPSYNGFAGTRGIVLPNFKALMQQTGCLWDYTLDYWNDQPLEIDPACETRHLLHIIRTNNLTKFKADPCDIIKERNLYQEIQNPTNLCTYDEKLVLKLQEKLELADLHKDWLKIREYQYRVDGVTYYKRHTGYYDSRNGVERQMTNFVLTYKGREVKDKTTYYAIEALCDGKTVLMNVPKSTLLSRSKFEFFLLETFDEYGLRPPKMFTTNVHKNIKYFLFHWFDSKNTSYR